MKSTFVLDTNVLLDDPTAIEAYEKSKVIIPFKVVEELEKHKTSPGQLGGSARAAIRLLDSLSKAGNILTGVQHGSVTVSISSWGKKDIDLLASKALEDMPDNRIIITALQTKGAVLVSNDLAMRLKAASLGLKVAAHAKEKMASSISDIYSGTAELDLTEEAINLLHSAGEIPIPKKRNFYPNQYLHLKSLTNPKHTAVGRVVDGKIKKATVPKEVFGLKPRNLEQAAILEALLDPEITLVSLIGKAGVGKTLIAMAAALESVLHKHTYEKLLIIRSPTSVGAEIGWLPGPQPLDANILTPFGWNKMGNIKVGVDVIGRDGKPTKVLGVFPKGTKSIYRITTIDDVSTECCEDHLWLTQTAEDRKRNRPGTVKNTKTIMDTLLKNERYNHFLPSPEPIQFAETKLPLSPYTLGALLGDGSISSRIDLINKDAELINRVREELSEIGCSLHNNGQNIIYNITCSTSLYNNKPARPVKITNMTTMEAVQFDSIGKALFEFGDIKRTTLQGRCESGKVINGCKYEFLKCQNNWSNPAKEILSQLGLANMHSDTKFIPHQYKYQSSVSDRIALLQGLMDTDGTIKKNGEASFCTTSKQLALDVIDIVRSLGGRAKLLTPRDRRNKKGMTIDGREITSRLVSYEFGVRLPESINPFYISRKANRHRSNYTHGLSVKSIEYVGEKLAQCILIENPEHLYITDNFIITHNTIAEKTSVHFDSIFDNLDVLFKSSGQKTKGMIEQFTGSDGIIEMGPPTFLRGRSLPKTFILVDECQNMTAHEIKTIATRLGEGSKLVVLGDVNQIDTPKLDALNNGLTRVIEAFKDQACAAHITLTKNERSSFAELAAELL